MLTRFKNHFFTASVSLSLLLTAIFLQILSHALTAYPHSPNLDCLLLVVSSLAALPLLGFRYLCALKLSSHLFFIAGVSFSLLLPLLIVTLTSVESLVSAICYCSYGLICILLGTRLVSIIDVDKMLVTVSWFALGSSLFVISVMLINAIGINLFESSRVVDNGSMLMPASWGIQFVDILGLGIIALVYLYAQRHLTIRTFSLLLVLVVCAFVFSDDAVSGWKNILMITFLAIAMQVAAIQQRTGSKNIRSLVRMALLLLPLYFILSCILPPMVSNPLFSLVVHEGVMPISEQLKSLSVVLFLLLGLVLWVVKYKAHQFNIDAWFFLLVLLTLLSDSIFNFYLTDFSLTYGYLGLLGLLLGVFYKKYSSNMG